MEPLTARQLTLLDFLTAYQAEHGLPPTLAEVAAGFGFQLNAARKHLAALAAKGAIELLPGKARGIRLRPNAAPALAKSGLLRLPLVGRVAAGAPILSEGQIEAEYAIDPALFRPRPHFLLRVQGESMIDAGIRDRDLIAVHRTPQAEHGQIVVARLDGEITVKRLCKGPHSLRLLAANPAYAPIEVPLDASDFAIEGVYVGVIRQA